MFTDGVEAVGGGGGELVAARGAERRFGCMLGLRKGPDERGETSCMS